MNQPLALFFTRISLLILYLSIIRISLQLDVTDIDGYSGGQRCGHTSFKSMKGNRVAGGKYASPEMFPSFVKIIARSLGQGSHCGGVIIHKNIILTAAHCVVSENDDVEVIAGLDSSGAYGEQRANVIKHCGPVTTARRDRRHDMNVMRLDRNFKYNKNVYPACLPLNITIPNNLTYFAIGVGKIDDDDFRLMRPLKYLMVQRQCNEQSHFHPELQVYHTCYSTPYSDGNICKGDSGSGIYANIKIGPLIRQTVFGVASTKQILGYDNRECLLGRDDNHFYSDIIRSKNLLMNEIKECLND